jgi:transaldolase
MKIVTDKQEQNFYDFAQGLFDYEEFDIRILIGDKNCSEKLCNLILGFGLVYNDLKFLQINMNLLSRSLVKTKERKMQGEFGGIQYSIYRQNISIIHELQIMINENKNVFQDPLFLNVLNDLSPIIRKHWKDLYISSTLDTVKNTSDPFYMIRNKTSSHYDLKEIKSGYIKKFDRNTEKPCVSFGPAMKNTRFYYADGADKAGMLEMYAKPYIKGLTTNPTLMNKAGITDYRAFAMDILSVIRDKPISFEVFSDDFKEMKRQALEIASWGDNVYVKIPVTNTKRETCYSLVKELAARKVKLNVTAVMTLAQVKDVVAVLAPDVPSFVSVFAGRIADTGRDPVPLMADGVKILEKAPAAELIWASPRELLNIFQADAIGCQVITVTNDILKKLSLVGFDLSEYSLDTVKMFYKDALAAKYKI